MFYLSGYIQIHSNHFKLVERYCEDLKEDIQYVIERLPEGGEGMYGIDDGQGDD
jgi:hypothetical protein